MVTEVDARQKAGGWRIALDLWIGEGGFGCGFEAADGFIHRGEGSAIRSFVLSRNFRNHFDHCVFFVVND